MRIRFEGQRIDFIITMAPKRKGITAIGSPGAGPSAPAQAGDRVATDGTGDVVREHPRHSGDRSQASGIVRFRDDELHTAGSGGGVVLPIDGAATSMKP